MPQSTWIQGFWTIPLDPKKMFKNCPPRSGPNCKKNVKKLGTATAGPTLGQGPGPAPGPEFAGPGPGPGPLGPGQGQGLGPGPGPGPARARARALQLLGPGPGPIWARPWPCTLFPYFCHIISIFVPYVFHIISRLFPHFRLRSYFQVIFFHIIFIF